MIEIVPSEHAREVLRGKREFTDFEKATLIWNSPIASLDEKIESLRELAGRTEDETLKKQIRERLEYEKKAFELFVENDGDKYIYVVLDEESYASGFFADYDVAKRFGIRLCKEYEMKDFVIEKQLVFKKADNYEIQEQDYSGTENVLAIYDKYGGLKRYYSNEIVDPMNYDSAEKNRFEYRFFRIPPVLEAGTVAKLVGEETYVIWGASAASWEKYMNSPMAESFDFFDIQNPVQKLTNNGILSHMHVNPLFLEPIFEIDEGTTDEERLLLQTLFSVGQFFKDECEKNNSMALDACRRYASYQSKDNSRVYKANSLYDILL